MAEDGQSGAAGAAEREALLHDITTGHEPTYLDPDGVRHRGVPQGRAVVQAIFESMADAEPITGVPGVRPGDEEGSHNWVRAERYWKDKYDSSRKNKVKNKFEAVAWLVAAFAVLNATEFIRICATDPRIVRTSLNIGLLAIVVMLCVMAYLIVWLSIVNGVDWDPHLQLFRHQQAWEVAVPLQRLARDRHRFVRARHVGRRLSDRRVAGLAILVLPNPIRPHHGVPRVFALCANFLAGRTICARQGHLRTSNRPNSKALCSHRVGAP